MALRIMLEAKNAVPPPTIPLAPPKGMTAITVHPLNNPTGRLQVAFQTGYGWHGTVTYVGNKVVATPPFANGVLVAEEGDHDWRLATDLTA
jgi:hypothetical protein